MEKKHVLKSIFLILIKIFMGETVMVYWLDRIRDMTKFDSVDQLVGQLKTDEEVARNWS